MLGSAFVHGIVVGVSASCANPVATASRRPVEAASRYLVRVQADTAFCIERAHFPLPSAAYACFDRDRASRQLETCDREPWGIDRAVDAGWASARFDPADLKEPTAGQLYQLQDTLRLCYRLAGVAYPAGVSVRLARNDTGQVVSRAFASGAGSTDASLLCCLREAILDLRGSLPPGHMARYSL